MYTPIRGYRLQSYNQALGGLVYLGQNRDVREILRNLIGRLKIWKLENTDVLREFKNPD